MSFWLAMAAAGALGGVLRFALSNALDRRPAPALPLGTLLANAAAALLVGFATARSLEQPDAFDLWLVLAGVAGSMSTVSTLAVQLFVIAHTAPLRALFYALVTVGFGMAMVLLGWQFGLAGAGAVL